MGFPVIVGFLCLLMCVHGQAQIFIGDDNAPGILWAPLPDPRDDTNILDTRYTLIPLSPGARINDIGYDPNETMVYWTDVGSDTIDRIELDGTNQENLIPAQRARNIALDLVNRKIYWTVTNQRSIARANLNGTEIETIFTYPSSPFLQPNAILVDPMNEYLLWSTRLVNQVTKATLNGTVVEIVKDSGDSTVSAMIDEQCADDTARLFYVTTSYGMASALGIVNLDESSDEIIEVIPGGMGDSGSNTLNKYGGKLFWNHEIQIDEDRRELDLRFIYEYDLRSSTFTIHNSTVYTLTNGSSITVISEAIHIFANETYDEPVAIEGCPDSFTINLDEGSTSTSVSWLEPRLNNTLSSCPSLEFRGNVSNGGNVSWGVFDLEYVATDTTGNTDICQFTITVPDRERPVSSCPTYLPEHQIPIGQSSVNVTYNVSATDNVDSSTEIACIPDSGSPFTVGPTIITCVFTDQSENNDTCSFPVNVTDIEAPDVHCPANMTLPTDTGTNGKNTSFNATTVDLVDASPNVVCSPTSGSFFSIGDTLVTCEATDESMNVNTCSFSVRIEDREQPIPSCPTSLPEHQIPIGQSSVNVTYNVSATDNVDSSPEIECSPGSGSLLSVGSTIITCVFTDQAENNDTCSFPVNVTDNEAPEVRCPRNMTLPTDNETNGKNMSFNATTEDLVDASPNIVCAPSSGSFFSFGDTLVTCEATDASMNVNTCSFNVRIEDQERPVPSCPTSLPEHQIPIGQSSVNITYNVSATDNVDSSPEIACSPESGSLLSVGSTIITCFFTDHSVNNDTCSFPVNVTDIEAPEVHCPPNMTLPTDNGTNGKNTSFNATKVDLVDASPNVVCSPSSWSFFSIGDTLVTCEATDASMNVNTCSFNIRIEDHERPVPSCPTSLPKHQIPIGQSSVNVTYNVSATDNVDSSPEIACSPGSGSLFSVGSTIITCVFTDQSENNDTCSFPVNVTDIEAPEVHCPPNMTLPTETGTNGKNTIFNATTVDLVDASPNVVCSPSSGSFFSIGDTLVTCEATDASMNVYACSFNIRIEGNFYNMVMTTRTTFYIRLRLKNLFLKQDFSPLIKVGQ